MLRKLCILCITALTMLLCMASAYAEKITVMLYLCGSNLESLYGSATADIQEILNSGMDTDEVQFLILGGGSTGWTDGTFSPDHLTIAKAEPKKRGSGLRLTTVDTLPNASMGSSETLSSFLDFAVTNYSADHYALILWNHGGGPLNGVCWDELYDEDHLTIGELSTALSNSAFCYENPLYFIGFDACLMGALEVADAVSPYADYMIASEQTEPGLGWNYSFLGTLANDGDAAVTGKHIVDRYFDAQPESASVLTMACYDLRNVAPVTEALDRFFNGVEAVNTENYSLYAEARRTARSYGRAYGAGGDYDLVDLCGFLQDAAFAESQDAGEVLTALDNLIVYQRSNAEGSGGISLFYPYYAPETFTADWGAGYIEYSVSPSYNRYLTAFSGIQTGDSLTDWSGLKIESDEEQNVFSLHLEPSQVNHVAKAELLLLWQHPKTNAIAYSLVYRAEAGYPDENGTLSVSTPRKMLANGEGAEMIPFLFSDDGQYRISIMTEGDYVTHGVLSLKAAEDNSMEIVDYFLYDGATQKYTNRHNFDITAQDSWYIYVMNYSPVYDESGNLRGFEEWKFQASPYYYGSTPASMQFRIEDHIRQDQRLFAVWQLTDVQGRTWCSDLVELKNDVIQTVSGRCEAIQDSDIQVTEAQMTAYCGQEIEVIVALTNTADAPRTLNYRDSALIINGQAIYDYKLSDSYSLDFEAGQTLYLVREYTPDKLYGVSEVNDFSIRADVIDPATGDHTSVEFKVELDENLDISGFVISPDLSNVIGTGCSNDVTAELISIEENEDGSLLVMWRFNNESDSVFSISKWDTKLLYNGLPYNNVSWKWVGSGTDKIPPRSVTYCQMRIGLEASQTILYQGDNVDCFRRIASLKEAGIQTLDSIGIAGITVFLKQPYILDNASNNANITLVNTACNRLTLSSLRVEPVEGYEDTWVIGLNLDAKNDSEDNHWIISGEKLIINGNEYEYAGSEGTDQVIRCSSSENYWLAYIVNELPANGISDIGFSVKCSDMTGIDQYEYTVTLHSDIPLNGTDITTVSVDQLKSGSIIDCAPLADEPEWSVISATGVLVTDDGELSAEAIDLHITEEGYISGWLRLTNETDTDMCGISVAPLITLNGEWQVANSLPINTTIAAHSSTWQALNIPLVMYVDRNRENHYKEAIEYLGFSASDLGLEQIEKIVSYGFSSYKCRLKLTMIEPLVIPGANRSEGETVFEAMNTQADALAVRTVQRDGDMDVYALFRISSNEESYIRYVLSDQTGMASYYYNMRALLPQMSGLYVFSWSVEDADMQQLLTSFYIGNNQKDLRYYFSEQVDPEQEAVWYPNFSLRDPNKLQVRNIPVSVQMDMDERVELSDTSLMMNEDGSGLTLSVELKNLTDTTLNIYVPMIECDGITYQSNVSQEILYANDTIQLIWQFDPNAEILNSSTGIILINTDHLQTIRIPVVISEEYTYRVDLASNIHLSKIITIVTEVNTEAISKSVVPIGHGTYSLGQVTEAIEVLGVSQGDDGMITLDLLLTNTTDSIIYNSIYTESIGNIWLDGICAGSNSDQIRYGALPGSQAVMTFTINNKIDKQSVDTIRNADLTACMERSGLEQFSSLETRDIRHVEQNIPTLTFTLNQPFKLRNASRHLEPVLLFENEDVTVGAISLQVIQDEDTTWLVLLTQIDTHTTRDDINPGVTTWVVNGERITLLQFLLYESDGLLSEGRMLRIFSCQLPAGTTEITDLSLNCIINSHWGSLTPAEIRLTEPFQVFHGNELQGDQLMIIPATF